jgi:hypothetical protein
MSEKNHIYLSIKDIFTESLARDLILFTFLFLLIISQMWDNILLLLFPLITFGFALFFRVIDSNKAKSEFKSSSIIYNPFGLEKKNANRLFFSSMLQLILLFWLGAESLYNPHIVERYYIYFIGFFIFFYTFGFFWILLDLWRYSKLEILTNPYVDDFQKITPEFSTVLNHVVSFLRMKYFRQVSILNVSILLILNLLNVISIVLIDIDSALGFHLTLPGSNIVESSPMLVSHFIYGLFVISPLVTILILGLNYRQINQLNLEKLKKIIQPLPKNLQVKIIESLKALNNKMKEQLSKE